MNVAVRNAYKPVIADQAHKELGDAGKQETDMNMKKSVEEVVSQEISAAGGFASEAMNAAQRLKEQAREVARAAPRKVGEAVRKVSVFADDNTAIIAVAAFGAGLLAGFLVSRKR
mgnify:CR=1 FL=1